MLLVLLVGVPTGYWIGSAQSQRIALAQVFERGGTAGYDYERVFKVTPEETIWTESPNLKNPSEQPWFYDLLKQSGPDLFSNVVQVDFSTRNAQNYRGVDSLETLANLPRLKSVRLDKLKGVDDQQFKHLAKLKDLCVLELWDLPITGKGLEHLIGLRELRSLWLMNMTLTPEGCEQLAKLKSLRQLRYMWKPASDEAIRAIGELKNLRLLEIAGPMDKGRLTSFRELKELRSLRLTDTRIDDLSSLTEMTKLKLLVVQGTAESKIFTTIPMLPELERLAIETDQLTVDELRAIARLPKLKLLATRPMTVTDDTNGILTFIKLRPDVALPNVKHQDTISTPAAKK